MSSGPAKILVADDSSSERASAREALESAGYQVFEAVDGQQALEVYTREKPDLVMLDVVMPRLTGLETCRILKAKAQASYLPVIMVSSRNSVNARVEGLRSGADDYLGKPYDAEELRARVEVLLRTREVLADADPNASRTGLLVAEGAESGTAEEESERPNANAFRRRLEEEFDRAARYSDPLACLRVEFDQFGDVSVTHSAEAASSVVLALRDVIEMSVRKIDLVFRIDDRGYILLLPNTHFPGALAVAERIARDAHKLTVDGDASVPLTVSVGVSFFPNKDTHSVQDLMDLVQAALERARSEGGGKICLFQHQGYLYAPDS